MAETNTVDNAVFAAMTGTIERLVDVFGLAGVLLDGIGYGSRIGTSALSHQSAPPIGIWGPEFGGVEFMFIWPCALAYACSRCWTYVVG